MVRRLGGLLIVLVTMVGVAVTSASARRSAGTAVAAPLPPAPAVGDCLIRDDPAPGSAWAVAFGPCVADALGQIVALRPAGTPVPMTLDGSTGCRGAVLTRAGLVEREGRFVLPGQPATDPVTWSYSMPARTGWYGPSPILPTTTSWAACVVRPERGAAGPASVIDAFDGGALPPVYGTCWESTEISAGMRQTGCAREHRAELIAVGRVTPGQSWEEIRTSCLRQAAQAIGRADPSVGGLLTVRMHPDRTGEISRNVDVTCYVTAAGDRSIVGSVVGLGPRAPVLLERPN
jgi:hypothetical protein